MSQPRTDEPTSAGPPPEDDRRAIDSAGGRATLPAESRAPGTVRANRAILTLLGFLLTLAGAAALAAGLGLFGRRLTDQPVLGTAVNDFVAANRWFWPVVAVAGGLLSLLCLWWLLVQGRSNRVSELRVITDPRRGHTDLAAGALTHAVTAEIEGYHGVTRASAHLSGAAVAPRLTLSVGLDGRVAPAEVHARVVREAVAHARQALGTDELPTRLELQLPRTQRRDVR